MVAEGRRRKFWGWGYEDEQLSLEETRKIAEQARGVLGFGAENISTPARITDLDLPPARRLAPPSQLVGICHSDVYERAAHAMGKSYKDVVRGFHGEIEHPPDLVAFPRTRTTSRTCWSGAPKRASQLSRSVAAPAWWAVSNRWWATPTEAPSPWTLVGSPESSTST